MRKIFLSFAVLAVAGAVYFGVNAIMVEADQPLLIQSIEALAQNEDINNNHYPLSVRCNVPQSPNGMNRCMVTITICSASPGYGCIYRPCPIHN